MTLNFASDKKIIFAIQVGRSNVCDSNNNELILNRGDPGIPMSKLHWMKRTSVCAADRIHSRQFNDLLCGYGSMHECEIISRAVTKVTSLESTAHRPRAPTVDSRWQIKKKKGRTTTLQTMICDDTDNSGETVMKYWWNFMGCGLWMCGEIILTLCLPSSFGQCAPFTPLLDLQTPRMSQAVASSSCIASSTTHRRWSWWQWWGWTPYRLFPKAQSFHNPESLGIAVPSPQTSDHAQDLHHLWFSDTTLTTESHTSRPKLQALSQTGKLIAQCSSTRPPGAGPLLTVVRRHTKCSRHEERQNGHRRPKANKTGTVIFKNWSPYHISIYYMFYHIHWKFVYNLDDHLSARQRRDEEAPATKSHQDRHIGPPSLREPMTHS